MSADAADGRNGGRVSFGWLAGVLVTVLLALGGALLSDMRGDLASVQTEQRVQSAQQAGTKAEVNLMQAQLQRIEGKLDRLLEGRR